MERSVVRRLHRLIPFCFLLMQSLAALATPGVAKLGDVVEYPDASASATVLSLSSATLSSQLTAVVDEVHREVGEHVTKGNLLLTLDCRDYRLSQNVAEAELDAAQANAKLAMSQANRSRTLLEKKLTSQQDDDDKEAGFIAARARENLAAANLKLAKLNVSRCQITAPFDGVISTRYLSAGQLATPGTPLFELVDDSNLEVSAQVSAELAGQIAEDTEVSFVSNAPYDVRLARAVSAINTQTRTRELRFQFTGDHPLPGSAGKIYWRTPLPHLPAKYLVTRESVTGFFVVDANVARFVPLVNAFPGRAQPVTLNLNTSILIPPLGDLKEGDIVSSPISSAEATP